MMRYLFGAAIPSLLGLRRSVLVFGCTVLTPALVACSSSVDDDDAPGYEQCESPDGTISALLQVSGADLPTGSDGISVDFADTCEVLGVESAPEGVTVSVSCPSLGGAGGGGAEPLVFTVHTAGAGPSLEPGEMARVEVQLNYYSCNERPTVVVRDSADRLALAGLRGSSVPLTLANGAPDSSLAFQVGEAGLCAPTSFDNGDCWFERTAIDVTVGSATERVFDHAVATIDGGDAGRFRIEVANAVFFMGTDYGSGYCAGGCLGDWFETLVVRETP